MENIIGNSGVRAGRAFGLNRGDMLGLESCITDWRAALVTLSMRCKIPVVELLKVLL